MATDQIDVENSERYGIYFTDKDNKRKHPIILHLSPSGSIERVMYALLEKAYMESQQGKNPVFPMWLSPTQIRIIPVSEKFVEDAAKISEEIEKHNIRVDVDDRNETVQKKIRDAETEWVPLIVVIGEREINEGVLAVRFRETGEVKKMNAEDVIKYVKDLTKDKPFIPLSLPKLITKRPVFIG